MEEALRVTTRQIRALQRLLDGFTEVPAPNDPPSFPPQEVVLPAPTRDTVERDKAEIARLNREYYACLNGRDVKGLLALWREDEAAAPGGMRVQMYANEDKIITGCVSFLGAQFGGVGGGGYVFVEEVNGNARVSPFSFLPPVLLPHFPI